MDLMNRVFHKYWDQFVVVPIDDIHICSANRQEREEDQNIVMELWREKMVMWHLIRIHIV